MLATLAATLAWTSATLAAILVGPVTTMVACLAMPLVALLGVLVWAYLPERTARAAIVRPARTHVTIARRISALDTAAACPRALA